ncbi:MAG: Rieske (2Fe-2S) protein [Terracidiphilus sp.]
MPEFVRICAERDLPPEDEVAEIEAAGQIFCVARLGGKVCVLDGVCPHEGGPLGHGVLEDGKVVCPWHAFAFDLKTGIAEHDPKVRAKVFEAKVERGAVLVKL